MDVNVILGAGAIFVLRVIGNMITTVRLVLIVRGRKISSSILGIFEALIFAVALGTVVTNLDHIWNLSAYCLGYAVGGYLGMVMEDYMIQRFVLVQAISPRLAHEIAVAVREAGFGATESFGQGVDGQVGTVAIAASHHQVSQVVKIIQTVDPKAFVMMEELRAVSRGFFRLLHSGRS